MESFSLPGKTEVDPTSIMAIFYYILFGMMLSDAAYGPDYGDRLRLGTAQV